MKTNFEAKRAYEAKQKLAKAELQKIITMIDTPFPENGHYGHVGDMGHIYSKLREITDPDYMG